MATVTVMNKFFYIITMLGCFVQSSLGNVSSFQKESQPVVAKLLTAQSALGGQKIIKGGLEFKLKSGFKIYAPPLDAKSTFSAAPQVTWDRSVNVESFEILWPPARTYTLEGFSYQAYKGDVILPIKVTVIDPRQPMTLNLDLNYSVCSTTCVPIQDSLTLTLQPGLYARHLGHLEQQTNC